MRLCAGAAGRVDADGDEHNRNASDGGAAVTDDDLKRRVERVENDVQGGPRAVCQVSASRRVVALFHIRDDDEPIQGRALDKYRHRLLW